MYVTFSTEECPFGIFLSYSLRLINKKIESDIQAQTVTMYVKRYKVEAVSFPSYTNFRILVAQNPSHDGTHYHAVIYSWKL